MATITGKNIAFGSLAILIFALLMLFYFVSSDRITTSDGDENIAANYSSERTFSLKFTLENSTGQLLENVEFLAFVPVSRTAGQSVQNLSANMDVDFSTDESGQNIAKFVIKNFAPYQLISTQITSSVGMADVAQPTVGVIEPNDYLGSERFIETELATIKTLADEMTGKNALEQAEHIHKWVVDNLDRRRYVAESRGAVSTLKLRQGDCTESAYLFAALARAKKIPTRVMGGYVLENSRLLKADDFHNWAEYFANGRWRISDPHRNILNSQTANYVATRINGRPVGTKYSDNHRFWISDARVRVQQR